MKTIDAPIPEMSYGDRVHYVTTPADLLSRGVPLSAVLPVVQALLKAEVDAEAEAQRLLYITGGAGQAMEYQEAVAQAAGAMAAPNPAAADYPMLAASIGIDIDPDTSKPATDVKGVARSVNKAFVSVNLIGAAIRGVRLSAKAAIDAAGTLEAAQAARDAVAWPPP